MSSRPLEQTLSNIIPRHPGILPSELVELASSLLAQSRSKASNLKADEEIGRTYACAHIACERLKTTLNLPKIEPRPPCPPKVYSKLYNHFDRILISSSNRKRSRSSNAPPTPVNALPERKTPTKEQSLAAFTNSRSSKRGLQHGGNKDSRLRPWIAPGIRKLCREFGAGKAIPHVLAGVESVLFLSRPELETGEAREKGMEGKIPALVIAVWFFVMTRLAGEETNGEEYAENRKRALRILHGLKEDEGIVEKIGEKEESWVDWEKVSKKDVDAWLVEVGSNGWIEMDWFLNIDKGSGIGGAEAEIEGERENELDIEAEERERRAKRVRRNRGTMIQDNVDYLSEAKRKEYAAWKAEILATIDNLIRDGVMDDKMDIDEI